MVAAPSRASASRRGALVTTPHGMRWASSQIEEFPAADRRLYAVELCALLV